MQHKPCRRRHPSPRLVLFSSGTFPTEALISSSLTQSVMCRAAQPLRRSGVHLFFFPLLPSSFSSLSLVQRRRAGGRKKLASHRHASSICFNVWRIQRRVRHNLLASIDLCGRYQQFALPQKRVHSRNPLLFDFNGACLIDHPWSGI